MKKRISNRLWLCLSAFFLIALGLATFNSRPIDAAESTELAAVRVGNQLDITIPLEANSNSSLKVELVNAEDKVVAEEQLSSENNKRSNLWQAKLNIPDGLSSEDLIWYRIHYRLTSKKGAEKDAIYPIKDLLRYPVVRLIGQKDLASGAANSLRILAIDGRNGEPLKSGTITVALNTTNQRSEVVKTTIDSNGTASPIITTPNDFTGVADLKITVNTALGSQEVVEKVNILNRSSILLTTDKPIYQPGHLIYIRSLALDRFSRMSIANRPITYEIEDAKGNKVFKLHTVSDEYGVASAQFQLAEEVNMGNFKLRAILGEAGTPQAETQEKTFVVDRYVLPKFKIEIKMQGSADERQQKKYYAPGDTVAGKVTASYLFGKPVARGRLKIKMTTVDVEAVDIGQTEAILDETGQYQFAMKLPNSFAGRSFEQGAAPVAFQVEVTDGANHTESRAESLTVSTNPILITAIPESGELVTKLTNKVYLLTSYPDGSPANTKITSGLAIPNKNETDELADGSVPDHTLNLQTNADGIAEMELNGNIRELKLKATDENGRVGIANVVMKQRPAGDESLIIRTDSALYKVGDKLAIKTISSKQKGSVYIDVIKDRQTILTKAIELEQGQAHIDLDLTPDLFGTIEVRAYLFGRNADPISDRRIIFVDPADDLQIDAKVAKESFRPGEEAQVNINVKDKQGNPKSAVLDIQVVDEAVFALSEKRPGLEKVFFFLEQELLKPRYEIHSVGQDDIVPIRPLDNGPEAFIKRKQAAKVLLAAVTEVNPYSLKVNYGQDRLESKSAEYYGKYYQLMNMRLDRAVKGLNKYYADKQLFSDISTDLTEAIAAGYLSKKDITDPWGRPTKITTNIQNNYLYCTVAMDWLDSSKEPLYFQIMGNQVVQAATNQQKAFDGNLVTRHGIGAANYAQIVGQITTDRTVPGARINIRVTRHSDGKKFSTRVDNKGNFQINGLLPGTYDLAVESMNFYGTTYQDFYIESMDQAIFNVKLQTYQPTTTSRQLQLYAYGPQDIRRRNRGRMNMEDAEIAKMERGAPPPNAQAAPQKKASLAAEAGLDDLKSQVANDKNVDSQPDPSANGGGGGGGGEGTKVRSYFPETLYVNPKLITDKQGHAIVHIPLADSITTWRMSMLASTRQGALGSTTTGIKVFQDFFIDIDLPVSLTQDDVVTIPVAIYNYLSEPQDIEITLQQFDWFTLVDDNATKRVQVGAGEVSAVSYRIRASRIGNNKLIASAKLLGRNSAANGDAIARQVEVIPNGEQQNITVNDRLENTASQDIVIPETSLADASKILVKFYTGPLSQVVEGLDSMLRMPNGCFEQTSATTYPNVLALDYMKATKHITPEIQVKAEGFISLGYQRLVTYEVSGGGFSWFGQAPANKILTGFGLMEFSDMSHVHEVDPRIIQRTQAWLANQQQADGSWNPDTNFIDEGTTNNFHDDRLRIAAYLGWTLAYSGYQGGAVDKAKAYVDKNLTGKEDAYTLAVVANFAVDYQKDPAWRDRMMAALVAKVTETDKLASWAINGQTPMHGQGNMAEIETTALATQALIKWGRNSNLATKSLNFLMSKKDAYGNWQSTQATILALRAFLLSQSKGSAADTQGTISININGKAMPDIKITPDNNDLMHQIDLKAQTIVGTNHLELRFAGKGSLLYQIIGRHYQPWERKRDVAQAEALAIDLKYDRTRLAQDDIATATVTIRNNLAKSANMVMIDLGIPPGFEVLGEDFQTAMAANPNDKLGNLTKYTITAKQVILYFDGLRANQSLTLKYRLRAKYPIKAKTFASRVYQYYNPEINAVAKPIDLVVTEKGH